MGAAALILSGCKTTGSTPDSVEYNAFYSPADHLKELNAAGDLDAAGKVYRQERAFFTTDSKKHEAVVGTYWTALRAKLVPSLTQAAQTLEARAWPGPAEQWEAARADLAQADQRRSMAASHLIVSEKRYPFKALRALETRIDTVHRRLRESAGGAFADYDLVGAPDFFAAYPGSPEPAAVMAEAGEALRARIGDAAATDLEHIHKTYADTLDPSLKRLMGERYFSLARAAQTRSVRNSLEGVIAASMQTRAAGLPLLEIPGIKIGMVEITSRTLLSEGQIEFPLAIDVDLPIRAEKAALDTALSGDRTRGADYLIIVDVALAKASRRVLGIEKRPSQVLAGYREVPNPEYNVVQNEIANARLTLQQASFQTTAAQSQYCVGLGCLGKLIGVAVAAGKRDEAQTALQSMMGKLAQTPQTIQEPIYRDYQFDVANVKARRTATVNYYVVNEVAKKYYKTTFDVIEDQAFNVAYRLHDRDTQKEVHLSASDTEADVAAWEEQPMEIPLSRLTRHYFENAGDAKRLPSLTAIRRQMLRDKNVALANFKAERDRSRPVEDRRLKHVVVVYTSAGGQGTGFFVKPDVVLTNWHVVQNTQFVELEMHGGQETFGKVIAKDVRLDLALIKVQQRGVPVRFHGQDQIGLGQTVEAIGHPKRLKFSVTRGVVSAARLHPSINLPGGGGKEVLYIQTDAAINRGNSGGPLFLGDRVIGVNTWGQTDVTMSAGGDRMNLASGLNFAVHHTEVTRFIDDYLPGSVAGGS